LRGRRRGTGLLIIVTLVPARAWSTMQRSTTMPIMARPRPRVPSLDGSEHQAPKSTTTAFGPATVRIDQLRDGHRDQRIRLLGVVGVFGGVRDGLTDGEHKVLAFLIGPVPRSQPPVQRRPDQGGCAAVAAHSHLKRGHPANTTSKATRRNTLAARTQASRVIRRGPMSPYTREGGTQPAMINASTRRDLAGIGCSLFLIRFAREPVLDPQRAR
jgi:hypothetical protein